MNFLGVGPFELLLILVIATIVLGPERMAQAGRTLGRLYAQYRLRWQKDVDEMTRELRRELALLQREVEEIRQSAEGEIKTAQAALESVVDIKLEQDAVGEDDATGKDSDTAQPSAPAPTEPTVDQVQSSVPADDETDEVEK